MCGRFTMLTWDEVEDAAKAVLCAAPLNVDPDWPARRTDAFPGSTVRAIVFENERAIGAPSVRTADFIWGFAMPNSAKSVFNARSESVLTSAFWKESFLSRRCIVPAAAFYEPHRAETGLKPASEGKPARKVKQTYRFASEDGTALLLAGVWQNDRLAILTTEPDGIVSPVHDRMPLLLPCEQALAWLRSADSAAKIVSSIRQTPANDACLVAMPVYPSLIESAQLTLF